MDCIPPGSSVHAISQARILAWVAVSFSRGSSPPRDGTDVSFIGRWILYHRATWEAQSAWQLTGNVLEMNQRRKKGSKGRRGERGRKDNHSYSFLTFGNFSGELGNRERKVGKLWTTLCICILGFPGDSGGKASAHSAGDQGSIPGWGRSPGEGNSNPLQYPCLENPMEAGAWQAIVHEVANSRTRLSDFTHSLTLCIWTSVGFVLFVCFVVLFCWVMFCFVFQH